MTPDNPEEVIESVNLKVDNLSRNVGIFPIYKPFTFFALFPKIIYDTNQ